MNQPTVSSILGQYIGGHSQLTKETLFMLFRDTNIGKNSEQNILGLLLKKISMLGTFVLYW